MNLKYEEIDGGARRKNTTNRGRLKCEGSWVHGKMKKQIEMK